LLQTEISPVERTQAFATERPDPRAMNAMPREHRFAHACLERWAKWTKEGAIRAWPSATILARVILLGVDGAAARGMVSYDASPEVALTDYCVAKLSHKYRVVLKKYYLEWAPVEMMARDLHINVSSFQARLKCARIGVAFGLVLLAPQMDGKED
jgi:hypothetical protein